MHREVRASFLLCIFLYIYNVLSLQKNLLLMTITTLLQSYFHAQLPDISIRTSAASVNVRVSLGSVKLYEEVLYTIDGAVVLQDLAQLVEPWLAETLTDTLIIAAMELTSDGASTSVTASASTMVVYGWVDVDMACSVFCNYHFLSLLNGPKTTSEGRLEYLHYLGAETGEVVAYYDGRYQKTWPTTAAAGNGKFTTIDVSPDRFEVEGKRLLQYTVTVGNRRQEFVMDMEKPDCAPVLLFTNSFGCQELLYCVGKHEVNPEYDRTSAYINKRRRNYRIVERRKFTADTGLLSEAEMNWVDELFRSKEIYVVNFVNGVPRVGKEVLISDSESHFSNEFDAIPRAVFTYMYAQRCHNVMQTERAGRIFDNTFDNTFD